MQCPHWSQLSLKAGSGMLQGGRICGAPPRNRANSKRFDAAVATPFPPPDTFCLKLRLSMMYVRRVAFHAATVSGCLRSKCFKGLRLNVSMRRAAAVSIGPNGSVLEQTRCCDKTLAARASAADFDQNLVEAPRLAMPRLTHDPLKKFAVRLKPDKFSPSRDTSIQK